MIDGQNFFDHPITNNLLTYDNIRKLSIGQGDDYLTGCLLDHYYFHKNYKMIAIDLSKQQALDSDPRAIQRVAFTGNLEQQATIFLIFKEAKQMVLVCSQGPIKVF